MTTTRTLTLSVAAILAVTGCGSPQLRGANQQTYSDLAATADRLKSETMARVENSKAARDKAAFVNRPYLAGKSTALAPEINLPLALRANTKTAVMFPNRRVSLPVFAQQVQLATGIPVVIAPDVYLPVTALLPRNQKLEEGSTQGGGMPFASAAPVGQGRVEAGPLPPLKNVLGTSASAGGLVAAGYSGTPSVDTPQDVEVQREEMPLNQTLDLAATRLGINWAYDAKKGAIRFYRMVTKVWTLPVKPASISYTTQFDGGTTQTSNQNAISASADRAPVKSEAQNINELTSILNDVQTVMSRAGSVSGNVVNGTITLNDTKDAVDRAETIIATAKGIGSKMVAVSMQVIQVQRNDTNNRAVDWQGLVTKAFAKVPGFTLTGVSPATLLDNTVGSIGGRMTSGAAAGSSILFSALSEVGTVASSDEIPLQSQNRHPMYYNNRVRFSYVSGTTPATATAGGTGGVPGLTTSQDQVGLKLMIYPTVMDNNNIALSVSFDSSVDKGLQRFDAGSGDNKQSVQLLNISGNGTLNDALVRNGGMTVLAAFEHLDGQDTNRTLGEDIPLLAGGSAKLSRQRTVMLIVLRASIRDMGAGQGAGS
ncbi:hypothetical protein CJ026_000205 [Ralstonia pickettii]|jgi:type IVB pilus formation R64 PilN family outer membrane protein|uniref:hypothetical protein n=1 Tax=Ralstonia pickettii TaxID=329 RepID=UPI000BD8B4B9|nr:hypothetical protein [Ralstonia pickettii]MBT2180850.1 hypothetical protein [Ralstonia pickettii]POH90108.1 hypothetical protein CJ026_000205 [Ralstonia pickettii]